MSWNWNVFLGFLIGIIVSTVIYLAVDVDLSKFDGLQILTAVLIAITIWYAYSTHRMLEEQEKSRQIAKSEKKLEFYSQLKYALRSIIRDENYAEYQYEGEQASALIKELKGIHKYFYLASPKLEESLNDLIFLYEMSNRQSEIMESSDIWGKIVKLIPTINKLINEEIAKYNDIYEN